MLDRSRRPGLPFLACLLLFCATALCQETAHPTCRLADAAEQQDWKLVSELATADSTHAAQPDGMTALHWAAFHNNAEAARNLLTSEAFKAQVDRKTEYGITPLLIACEHGNDAIAELLLDAGASVDVNRRGKISPLHLAARQGNQKLIKLLINNGAEPDTKEAKHQTPLMWAAAAGNNEATTVLLEKGADANAFVPSGFTALLFATRQGHSGVVVTLLNAGVDVTHAMKPEKGFKRAPRKGTSALTLAVESGHFELAMQLIERGADPNDQRSGFAPLHALSWVRKPNRGEEPDGDPPPRGSGKLNSLQFVRAIVAAGADVNLQLKKGKSGKAHLNRTGATPLLLAAKTADLPYMKLLVELGADATLTNTDDCTPLMAAAGVGVRSVGEEAGTEEEVVDCLAFLLEQGNELDAVDKNKETAMHGAAYRCFPRAVEFLGSMGTDPSTWNHKNVSGWTPVMIAQGHRPGSFKPHPPTVTAIEALIERANEENSSREGAKAQSE